MGEERNEKKKPKKQLNQQQNEHARRGASPPDLVPLSSGCNRSSAPRTCDILTKSAEVGWPYGPHDGACGGLPRPRIATNMNHRGFMSGSSSGIEYPQGTRVNGLNSSRPPRQSFVLLPMPSLSHPHRRTGLVLQPRDLDLLGSLVQHRFLKSSHLHSLLFYSVSRRIVQTRLQKLFAHGYLRRLYIPVILDGQHTPLAHSRQPIYTLTARGMRLIREAHPAAAPPEQPSIQFLAHHLVVTDCLVALAVAARASEAVELVQGAAETLLWSRLRKYRQTHRLESAIVPDGVFTLRYATTGETLTFYLEVIRADVRGGNNHLMVKLRRYADLHHRGFFRDVYDHEPIRAVLLTTTSEARADHLRRLAADLPHGRRLFWFGSYQETDEVGRLHSRFTAERILRLPWQTAAGETVNLFQPRPPRPLEGAAS